MVVITQTPISVKAGDRISCKYPKHGTRNILTTKEGIVQELGHGPAGPYVQIEMPTGEYRNLSLKRCVDLVVS